MESTAVKFTAAAADVDAWRSFLEQEIGTKDISVAYIFLRLDGRVRSSGKVLIGGNYIYREREVL